MWNNTFINAAHSSFMTLTFIRFLVKNSLVGQFIGSYCGILRHSITPFKNIKNQNFTILGGTDRPSYC